MTPLPRLFRVAVLAAAAGGLAGCAGQYFRDAGAPPPPPRLTLATLPHKEIWTGIVFNGAKIGFSHSRLENLPGQGLHRLESEAVMRFQLLGFEKNMEMRAEDIVHDDLSLVRFRYRYHLDNSELALQGSVKDGKLVFDLSRSGEHSRQELPLSGPVYPAGALTLIPAVAGLEPGSTRTFTVFSGELQQLAEVVQRVEGYERSTLFAGNAFKVVTELLGLKTTTWIDAEGRPLFELGMNGVMISALEEEAAAKRYLAAAATNKDEVFLAWSRIPVDRPIEDARTTTRLRLALEGVPRDVPADARQQCTRTGELAICDVDAARKPDAGPMQRTSASRPSSTVQSLDPAVRSLAQQLIAGRTTDSEKYRAILSWIERNIRKEAADVFSALDALDTRRAECQGHTYLYTALARASGIPTRVANGIVYSPEHRGFLYHTWAESLIAGHWQAVDPTFGQAEADATHIALVYGESLGDLVPLVDWLGKLRARVLDASAP